MFGFLPSFDYPLVYHMWEHNDLRSTTRLRRRVGTDPTTKMVDENEELWAIGIEIGFVLLVEHDHCFTNGSELTLRPEIHTITNAVLSKGVTVNEPR